VLVPSRQTRQYENCGTGVSAQALYWISHAQTIPRSDVAVKDLVWLSRRAVSNLRWRPHHDLGPR
jgi:hypothetical protein